MWSLRISAVHLSGRHRNRSSESAPPLELAKLGYQLHLLPDRRIVMGDRNGVLLFTSTAGTSPAAPEAGGRAPGHRRVPDPSAGGFEAALVGVLETDLAMFSRPARHRFPPEVITLLRALQEGPARGRT